MEIRFGMPRHLITHNHLQLQGVLNARRRRRVSARDFYCLSCWPTCPIICVLSAKPHKAETGRPESEGVALSNPVMPIRDGFGRRIVGVNGGQCGMADKYPAAVRIMLNVVRFWHGNTFDNLIGPPVDDRAFARIAVADEDASGFRIDRDPMNAFLAGNLLQEFAGRDVDNVQAGITLVGDKKPTAGRIKPEMIELSRLARQLDSLDEAK